MADASIQRFKQKYEALAGIVHLAASTDEAADIVA